jgi:hypothetical protein
MWAGTRPAPTILCYVVGHFCYVAGQSRKLFIYTLFGQSQNILLILVYPAIPVNFLLCVCGVCGVELSKKHKLFRRFFRNEN